MSVFTVVIVVVYHYHYHCVILKHVTNLKSILCDIPFKKVCSLVFINIDLMTFDRCSLVTSRRDV